MRYDVMSKGSVIHICLASNMMEARQEIDALINQGKFNFEKPEFIRANAYMTYKYFNLDGTENYEETKKHLIDAGYEKYLR